MIPLSAMRRFLLELVLWLGCVALVGVLAHSVWWMG